MYKKTESQEKIQKSRKKILIIAGDIMENSSQTDLWKFIDWIKTIKG